MDCQCIRGKGQNLQVRKDLKRAAGRVVLKFCLTGQLVKELKNTDSWAPSYWNEKYQHEDQNSVF